MSDLEPELEALLRALDEAAWENRQTDFDRLERQLLDRFPGGFSAMPDAVHERYVEVDRAWPAQPGAPGEEPSTIRDLGPRTPLTARIPALLLDWLREQAMTTGRHRSDVLAVCLQMIQEDHELVTRLMERLRRRD